MREYETRGRLLPLSVEMAAIQGLNQEHYGGHKLDREMLKLLRSR